MVGCHNSPASELEPEASKAAAAESATAWSPDALAKMKKAHENARSGADEGGAKPQKK